MKKLKSKSLIKDCTKPLTYKHERRLGKDGKKI